MATVKAGRNKTIDTPLNEGQVYLKRCITVTQEQADLSGVVGKIIVGNMLDACSLLPSKSIDMYNRKLIQSPAHGSVENLLK